MGLQRGLSKGEIDIAQLDDFLLDAADIVIEVLDDRSVFGVEFLP